jgi:SAM-dependent methyltransferase
LDTTAQVQAFYNRYPFPPEPLLNMPPLGWNWRWDWSVVHCRYWGYLPQTTAISILDAGCGTGFGSQYLGHQNPQAQVLGIDLSDTSLAVARERCQRAEVPNASFQQGSLLEVTGQFPFINCVGVLHHLPNPLAGLQALGNCLATGGLMHLFVYSELGRQEIKLMQEALRLLQPGDAGVQVGRAVFKALPETNHQRRFELEHWAEENREDACFADMYLQVQETCFNIYTLLDWIEQAGLQLVGFSNPEFWQIERLLGNNSELMERAAKLSTRDYYRLVELLDPTANHYELFVSNKSICRWLPTDSELLESTPLRCPYIGRWPELNNVFNYCYQELILTEQQTAWLLRCDGIQSVAQLNQTVPLPLTEIRILADNLLVLLRRPR